MTDNVHHLFPDLIPDHDEDGDGYSDSAEMVVYDPPVPVVVSRGLPTRDIAARWLEECRGALEYRWDITVHHGLRLPLYAGRAASCWHRGVARISVYWWAWVRDHAAFLRIDDLRTDPTVNADRTSSRTADEMAARAVRVRWRWGTTLVLAVLLGLVIRWGIHTHPWWSGVAAAAVTVILGLIGARRGEVVEYYETTTEPAITTDLVIQAFTDAGITKIERPVTVAYPGPARDGSGYRIKVSVPGGMTYLDDVLPKARRLASGLQVARARIDFEPLELEADSTFEIYVSDVHPSQMPVPDWPLLTAERWNIWDPVPMGAQLKGDLELLSLIFTSLLVGAAPRAGKTWTARLPFLAAALDPSVQIDLFDFKGAGDWSMFNGIAGHLIEGPADEGITTLRDFLRDDLWPDVQRRSATIRALGSARAPGAKVSPALSADPSLRLHIRMVMVDECHLATEHPDLKDEIIDLLRKVTAQAPAGGVIVVLATQKPDAEAVPTKIAGNMNTRIAGRCLSWQASQAILGTAAKAQGWEAETISRKQAGTVIMLGAGDDAGASNDGALIRACLVDGVQAEEICRRARRLRRSTVTVQSVDDIPPRREPEVDPIVRAVLDAWPHPEVAAHQVQLAESIGMKQMDLSAKLRSLGLRAQQVRAGQDGQNRNGYYLADIQNLTRP